MARPPLALGPRGATLLLLILAVALWMPGPLFGEQSLWVHDLRHHHTPWRVWAAGEWLAGRVPTWSPAVALGYPLMAEGQAGAFYPPNLLFGLLHPGDALDLSVASHLLWAGLGAAALGRRLGQSEGAARLFAVSFAFSGLMATHSLYLGFLHACAWLPWLLCAVLAGSAVGVGLCAAMMLVAGHPQAAVFGLLLAGALALREKRVVAYVLGVGAGALVAGPQLAATASLLGETMRPGEVSGAFADIGSLWPPELINGLLPTFFGYDRPGDIAETYHHRGGGYWGRGEDAWEMAFFLGLPAVVLALVGARGRRFWVGLGLLALGLMLGRYTPLWPLLRQLPGLDGFRFPVRFSLVLTLIVGLLAAFGLDRLDDPALRRRARGGALVAAGALLLGMGALSLGLDLADGPLRARLIARFSTPLPPPPLDLGPLQAAALPQPEPNDPAQAPARAAAILSAARSSASPMGPVVSGAALTLLACAAALGVADGRRRAALLTGLLYLDLHRFGAGVLGEAPQALLDAEPAALPLLEARPGRYAVVDRRVDPALDVELLSSSLGLLFGQRDVLIPSPLLRLRAEALLAQAGLDVGDKGAAKVARLAAHPQLVDLLGLRWLLSVHDLEAAGYPRRADLPGGAGLFENLDPFPAAWVVACSRLAAEPFTALLGAELRGEAIVEEPEGAVPCTQPAAAGVATVVEEGPNVRLVTVEATAPGLLVLGESGLPGWSVTRDGAPATLLRANLVFMGVLVPAGRSTLRFVYTSPGLYLGPLGLLALLGLWARERRARATRQG